MTNDEARVLRFGIREFVIDSGVWFRNSGLVADMVMNLSKGPTIVAHRGLHDKHVENTLAAFKAGWEAGIEWCECDVHFSSDGVAVVIHDDTVDRTTSGTGFVANLNAKQLKKMG